MTIAVLFELPPGSTVDQYDEAMRVAGDAVVHQSARLYHVCYPARAPQLPDASVAQASFDEPDAVRSAPAGAPVALMVSASEGPNRVAQHTAFVDAAAAAGVDGVIRGPAGDGVVAAVAQDDIADAATAVLLAPARHAGSTYDLTGPEDIGFARVATLLSAGLGRRVTYQPETLEQAYASRAAYGAPGWLVDAWVSTYTAVANGELAGVSDAVPQLTGHQATSLADLLHRPGFAS